jgi:signal transduction histidine kinase
MGRSHRWLCATWLAAMAGILGWSVIRPTVASSSLAVGYWLLGMGFALTAVLLSYQKGQLENSRLFGVVSLTWVAGQVGARGAGWLTVALLWVGGFVQPAAAAAFLRYPAMRLEPPHRHFIVILSVVLGLLQAALLLTSSPSGWEEHLRNEPWPSLWANAQAFDRLSIARYTVWAVGAAVLLALMGRRWSRLGDLERRTLAPIMVTAMIAVVLVALRLGQRWVPQPAALMLSEARAYAAAAVALAFVISALQMRLAQSAVADLAADLDGAVSVDQVRDALRRRLGDRSLDVWYWLVPQCAYVDGYGIIRQPTAQDDRVARPVLTSRGDPLGLILIRPDLARHEKLVSSAITISRYALENARLEADLRQQVVALRDARTRLISSGIEQRRRLERDLHDGAQQRLLAIGMQLAALEAAADHPDMAARLQRVREELLLAMNDLRDLAHGLYPAVLSQAGLAPALEAVVERLPMPVQLTVEQGRFPASVENAAYLIACESLSNACKHAGPCTVVLDIRRSADRLVITIRDDGRGTNLLTGRTALRGIRDRVDALGGTLRAESLPGEGTSLTAELPCA